MSKIPWGVNRLGSMFHPECSTQLPNGRWVLAVCIPYHKSIFESLRAAWWVLTGRAEAVVWPEPGDLEQAVTRSSPITTTTGKAQTP